MCCFKNRKADISVIYKRINGLNLPMQLFLPDGNIHRARTILCIHGGGWKDAIKDNGEWDGGRMASNARFFAEHGFIAITASYRSLELSETLNVSDLLEDCTDMVKYIRKHIHFIDFSNIVYMGDSAGGYFAVMMGLSQNDLIRPYGVIALNPVIDGFNDKWKYGFLGIDADSMIPKNIIGEKCSDFLLMHGTADTVTDIEHTKEFNDMLLKKEHNSEFVGIPDAQHAFILYDYKYPDEYVNLIMKDIIEYINNNW